MINIVHMCCLLYKVFAEKFWQEEEDQIILNATQLVLYRDKVKYFRVPKNSKQVSGNEYYRLLYNNGPIQGKREINNGIH